MSVNYRINKPVKYLKVSDVRAETIIPNHRIEFERAMEFINCTDRVLYIGFRDGTMATINPVNRLGLTHELIVRKRVSFNRNNRVSMGGHLVSDVEESAIRESYTNMELSPISDDYFTYVDYIITKSDLESNGGTIYYAELDIIISISINEEVQYHPYASKTSYLNMASTELANDYNSTTFDITIVDNKDVLSKKYINLAGKVHEVTPVLNSSADDGVYITRTRCVTSNVHDVPPPTIIKSNIEDHSPEDGTMEPTIYDSFQDALELGDPKKIRTDVVNERERELREKEHALKTRELELKNLKIDLERKLTEEKTKYERESDQHRSDKLRLEKQLDELKHMQQSIEHEHKMKSIKVKDTYEERSYRRKDKSEFIKYLPAMVTGIVGIATLINKIK